MFTSNVRKLMDKKGKSVRGIAQEISLSQQTVFRATQDATIGGCQLNTLAKIGGALGVKTKRLYDEPGNMTVEEQEAAAHSRR